MTKPKNSTSKEQGTRSKEQVELLQNASSSGLTRGSSPTVGDQLKMRRVELGLDLHAVEVATKIRGRYLRWIEASDFEHLPHDIYVQGFVRKYAEYVGLPAAQIVAQYQAERGGKVRSASRAKPRPLEVRMSVTTRWLASLGALAVLAGIIAYMVWQFSSLTAAPSITLKQPASDGVVTTASIPVKGTTTPGTDVFLNDTPLPSDVNGNFTTSLILQPGVNSVRVVARNKLGKESSLTRNILSKQPVAEQLPTSAYDGVAVQLKASDAANVVVVIDGKESFKGILAAGSNRVFKGAKSITITVDNPAAVSAMVTNSKAANANLGALGEPGATKRTIELAKDTIVN